MSHILKQLDEQNGVSFSQFQFKPFKHCSSSECRLNNDITQYYTEIEKSHSSNCHRTYNIHICVLQKN